MARRYLTTLFLPLLPLLLVVAIGKVTSDPTKPSPGPSLDSKPASPHTLEEASAPASDDFVPASFTETDGESDENFLNGEESAVAGQEGSDAPFADEEPGLAPRPKAAPLPVVPGLVANRPAAMASASSPGSPSAVIAGPGKTVPMTTPHQPDDSGPESPEPDGTGPQPRQPDDSGPESPEPEGTEQSNDDYESDGYASNLSTSKPTPPTKSVIEPEADLKGSAATIDSHITTGVVVSTIAGFFFLYMSS